MQKEKNEQGFTLVEVIVSVAIFVILSGVMVLSYSSTDASSQLNQSQAIVSEAVKETRNKSVSIEEYGKTESEDGIFPSYGAYFEEGASEIIIYANCILDDNGSGVVDHEDRFYYQENSNECVVGNSNGFVERISLGRDTEITSITTHAGDEVEETQNVSIEYIRPLPDVWITGASNQPLPFGYVTIELGAVRSDENRTVEVYTSGLIETP